MEAVVKLDGAVAIILEKLVSLGYFKTKSEAIRSGILGLGKEYRVINSPEDIEAELVIRKAQRIESEIKQGKRKTISLDDALKRTDRG